MEREALKLAEIIEHFDSNDESLPLELLKEIATTLRALAQPAQEPVFKWRSVFQEMPTEDSHLLFCFGVHVVEGSYTRNGWASLAYGEAQPDFWAYMPPPPHHKRNQELYAMPPQREWVGLTDEEIDEGNKQSWVSKQAWQSAVWWASEKLKEKNG